MNSVSPSAAGGAVVGRRVGLELVVEPALEVGGLERHRLHPHVGVRETAELGALTGVDAGLVGLQPQVVDAARHDVRLPLSLGIQKLWITSRLVPRTSTLVPVGITS